MSHRLVQDVAIPFARLLWEAAWRAQSLHLAVFIVPPLLLVIGKGLLALAFPLLVIVGPGDSKFVVGQTSEHLHDARCWVALASCAYAQRSVPGIPQLAQPADTAFKGAARRDRELFVKLPRALSWRHLWFLGWLTWFLLFLHAREQDRDEDVPRSPG